MSPGYTDYPYLGPVELLPCLSSPLYNAQPFIVSEKAYNLLLQVLPQKEGEPAG